MLNSYPEPHFYGRDPGGSNGVYRIDLHDTSNGRDAVYIIRILELAGEFQVVSYWGRMHTSLQMKLINTIYTNNYKSNSDAMSSAYDQAVAVSSRKIKKGYNLIFMNTIPQGNPKPSANSAQTQRVMLPVGINHMPILLEYEKDSLTKAVLSETHVLEEVGVRTKWVYVFLTKGQWHIYDSNRIQMKTIPCTGTNIVSAQKHDGYVFLGYLLNHRNTLVIFDIIDGLHVDPVVVNIEKKPWNVRRAMLTHIFSDLYSGRDPYDVSLDVYLNDYTLDKDDKEWLFNEHPKTSSNLLIRKVSDKLYTSLLVKTS